VISKSRGFLVFFFIAFMKELIYQIGRRRFIANVAVLAGAGLALKSQKTLASARSNEILTISIITDLHHDLMPDGLARLNAFARNTKAIKPDAVLQMGDFAYPDEKNRQIIDLFNHLHPTRMHVIGNHDTDAGHTQNNA
jgi:Icc protein